MRQLGMILLDNAIKYTPRDGSIRIAVSQFGPFATLTISDSGIGISSDDLPHIFERFYRADRARERDEHGSGLGLAIARWIVEAHHGEVKVESAPGKGSVITVLFPAVKRVSDQTSPKIATGRRKRVRQSALGLDAIRPLARLAHSVSRPVRPMRSDAKRASGKTRAVAKAQTDQQADQQADTGATGAITPGAAGASGGPGASNGRTGRRRAGSPRQ
jgi:anti-sigma regulatory factor (Ser/Thr protein kinase)